MNPLDIMIQEVSRMPPSSVVADMGCGEARLAATLASRRTGHKVHSFDLAAPKGNPFITPCDMSRVPLPSSSVNAAIFSLSLMGTNYWEFLTEANRIVKPGGRILIAEVRSRFEGGGGEDGGDDEEDDRAEQRGSGAGPRYGHRHGAGMKRGRDDRDDRDDAGAAAGSGGGLEQFVAAVQSLGPGYTLTRRDEKNTMFVLLFFTKKGGQTPEGAGAGAGTGAGAGARDGPSAAPSDAGGAQDSEKQKKKKRRKNKNKLRADGGGSSANAAGAAGAEAVAEDGAIDEPEPESAFGSAGWNDVSVPDSAPAWKPRAGFGAGKPAPPSLKACVYKKR